MGVFDMSEMGVEYLLLHSFLNSVIKQGDNKNLELMINE